MIGSFLHFHKAASAVVRLAYCLEPCSIQEQNAFIAAGNDCLALGNVMKYLACTIPFGKRLIVIQ